MPARRIKLEAPGIAHVRLEWNDDDPTEKRPFWLTCYGSFLTVGQLRDIAKAMLYACDEAEEFTRKFVDQAAVDAANVRVDHPYQGCPDPVIPKEKR
jgi:hypothetical protein